MWWQINLDGITILESLEEVKQKGFLDNATFQYVNVDYYYVKKYFEVIDKLIEKYKALEPNYNVSIFKKLKISNYFENYRYLGDQWFYQRHHIDEIFISGVIYKAEYKEEYDNGLSIIVDIKEHAFLHYLIIMAQSTAPNNGMDIQVSREEWDEIIREYCEKYDCMYDQDWEEFVRVIGHI
ncbi:hypothetical protein [Mycoplasma sp. 1932B]|uniref:hypothetical protein n=1 Tax=unclassified Mycoplasma TaxID=2683645 RepID=UPI003AB0E0E8